MKVADFDFDLPDDLIAQEPRPRGESRLLVVDRRAARWDEATFRDLPSFLRAGDRVVVNDTRVFPARLLGRRDPSGGAVECLLLEEVDAASGEWLALVHPGQKLKPGARFVLDDPARAPGVAIHGEILERLHFGRRRVRLAAARSPNVELRTSNFEVVAAIDAVGHMPLPPYIVRPDTADDRARYQTVYAQARGSVAAPTAGLHFDESIFEALAARDIARSHVTLHVGYGTFKPVRVEEVAAHQVDPERYAITAEVAAAIRDTRAAGGRIVAVGTTTTRALEHAARTHGGEVQASAGEADIFIYPGHSFAVVDALVTNFHLPRSSLLMLVAAFAGRDLVLAAYRHAIARGFRFYSYGDAMLIV